MDSSNPLKLIEEGCEGIVSRDLNLHLNGNISPSMHIIDILPDLRMEMQGDIDDEVEEGSSYHSSPLPNKEQEVGTTHPPSDRQWPFLLQFEVGCFGISLGLSSHAFLLKILGMSNSMGFFFFLKEEGVLDVGSAVAWYVALVAVVLVFSVYALKCKDHMGEVKREFFHPERVNFFFTPWMACMFLTMAGVPTFSTWYISLANYPLVWCLSMAPILGLELKLYGQWILGGKQRRLSKVANPSTHLAITGNFVGALFASSLLGWKEVAIFLWGVGGAHYMVLFVTLYQRLPNHYIVPKDLHPAFFFIVGSPSIACLAWESIVGHFDNVCRISYFLALFLFLSLVVRLNFFCGCRFSVACWAYSFPVSALAMAAVRHSSSVTNHVTICVATLLTITSITIVAVLASFTLYELGHNTLIGSCISPPPTDTTKANPSLQKRGKKQRRKYHLRGKSIQ